MSTKKSKRNKVPVRLCISCGKEKAKSSLLRIVQKDDSAGVDETGKSHGRGAYICKNKACIEKAFQEEKISQEVFDEALENLEKSKFSMLSIAAKSGNISSGEFQVLEAIKTGSAFLVVIADDASENTKKKFSDKCEYYEVPCITFATKDRLGNSIGKEERSCASINDEGLANSFQQLFEQD